MPTTEVTVATATRPGGRQPHNGWRSTTEDRPRREDRAGTFDAALAQAVEQLKETP